jgi:hypothetical protein
VGINTMLGYPDFGGAFPCAKTKPEQRERYWRLVFELGAPPVRDLVMSWARVQPTPGGEYDFSLGDELVRAAQSRGIDLLALCSGTPPWASTHQPAPVFDFDLPALETETAFRRFVRSFVERYDGDGTADMEGLTRPIRAYEFMQEMEDTDPEEYAHWLRVFYESVKDADSTATVSLGSLRSPGVHIAGDGKGDYPRYLERLLAATSLSGPGAPYFDVVSFHSYPESYPGHRPFEESLAYINGTLATRGLNRPVWLTEFGCQSCPSAPQMQGARLVQWALRARAIGIQRAYIYCLWDYHWESSKDAPEQLGLVTDVPCDESPVKKPAFLAVSTLLGELKERPEVSRQDENVYRLGGGTGEATYAVWLDPALKSGSQLLSSGWWNVQTLDGPKVRRQASQIELSATPLFVQRARSPFMEKSSFLLENTPVRLDKELDKEETPSTGLPGLIIPPD